MKNPWTKISSTIAYENNWIRVEHQEVITPTGSEGIYGKVHFKNIAVGIIAMDAYNNIWLVGQYRYPCGIYSWEIPEGGCPSHEEPKMAALRELEEEAGLIAGSIEMLTEFYTSNSVTDEKAIIFVAKEITFTTPKPDPTERLVVKKIALQDALGMIFDGQITDSLTIIALLMLKEKLKV
jgi:8-oxo-dGTP pyrophosphatase MutT (NUDIX family)